MAFADKVIVLTGASSGIGAYSAVELAKENALLVLVGRSAEKFEKVVERIKETGAELEPLVILADVSIDAERIIEETIERFGRIDVLINNAGFGVMADIEGTNLEDFDRMMATNVRGAFELAQRALPHLIESQGNILNVSSIVGIRPFVGCTAYCLTKSALDHFTSCAALGFAPRGVRVNSINPGFIDNEFHVEAIESGCYEQTRDAFLKIHPIGRVGQNVDIYNAIKFLIDNEVAGFITGAILPVDGGACLNTGI